jgi:UDP-N-acetylglucosamine--N-acetylmuramyl-(pentapeptide) pyrophosphoryl-undecaprenol N-acetylglucosamine transferase
VYFPQAAKGLKGCPVDVVGMPVRSQFLEGVDCVAARMALGLNPDLPVVLAMGGSQGARGLNDLVIGALPELARSGAQVLHLTGAADFGRARAAFEASGCPGAARAFLSEMDLALGAATVAVSRAGASSSAELAAMRLPAILIPFPAAADNHQFFNAKAFADDGAAVLMEQSKGTAAELAREVRALIDSSERRLAMGKALEKWHFPEAAATVAARILEGVAAMAEGRQ